MKKERHYDMRHLVAMCVAALLVGCSVMSYFQPAPFDPIEYGAVVSVTQTATRTTHQCVDRSAPLFKTFLDELNTNSMYLLEYASNKQDNVVVSQPAQLIRSLVLQFDSRAVTSSVAYCQEKLTVIQATARTTERALGRLEDSELCNTDYAWEFKKYTDLHESKLLHEDEFTELTKDLLVFGRVNSAACDSHHRAQIEAALGLIEKAVPLAGL